MDGLMMEYGLTLPAMLHGREEVVSRKPDKSFHLYLHGFHPSGKATLAGPDRPRPQRRRPRRDPRLEPLPTPRSILRHTGRGRRAPHPEPPPAPRRPGVHREPRRRPGVAGRRDTTNLDRQVHEDEATRAIRRLRARRQAILVEVPGVTRSSLRNGANELN